MITAIVNARVLTMDRDRPAAQAVAWRGNTIVAVGSTREARRLGGRRIDAGGRLVVPGLIDAHLHLSSLGRRLLTIDLSAAQSMREIVESIAELARQTPKGRWIRAGGWRLDAFPTHDALSAAVPDHPVWLTRKDGHCGLANAKALEAARITPGTPDPPGGRIGREGGRLTGLLFESAMDALEGAIPPPRTEETARAVEAAQGHALARGITSVHDACADEGLLEAFRLLERHGRLTLRVHAMAWLPRQPALADLVRETRPIAGDRLSVRAIKLFLDGSLGSRTCWMLRPFRDARGDRGVPRLAPGELRRIVAAATARGWQVCVHAIGDRANREVLRAYADAPRGARLRVEHAQHVDPEDLGRFAELGVIASMQPSHAAADRAMCRARLDARARAGSYAWRAILAPGARLALGTDAPVETIDPRWTMACATRGPQALTRLQALHGMTAGAAYAGFQERACGRLLPGLRADIAVLEKDWPRLAGGTGVFLTVADGRIAHSL
jgi:hypothetical protein